MSILRRAATRLLGRATTMAEMTTAKMTTAVGMLATGFMTRGIAAAGMVAVGAVATGVTTLTAVGMSTAALAGPVEMLPGRWTGWGRMTMSGGETEKVKCIATYLPGSGRGALRHSLRCASTNYTIDAVADLVVAGNRVSGKWQERKYSTGGSVRGRVVGDGLSVAITGQSFRATLKVETTKCRQKMAIAPKGMGISRIAVNLSKC